ncbi:73_t:CDS:2, partial [Scutellospora calospora]
MQYNTIASYRLAISKVYEPVEEKAIGVHSIIIKCTSYEIQKSLFFTTTVSYKLASTDSIAQWIKSCLTKSLEDLIARDVRVISAFLAQNSEADLAIIM